MAVQQNKKSPSRRGMHRSHDALTPPALSVDRVTGEVSCKSQRRISRADKEASSDCAFAISAGFFA